ncbi:MULTISPECIES: hypothetical protein [Chryseobacterium]|uniref:hypothetical protein n=1 Tax=Chryseobacterium TaxID=59732 RepID=UPI001BE8852B|nr:MULTISPECIES: hypothetical protein [Chryseobacterium]MBT2622507.1 hypothetical protein [Chryseobacterium sp. ISL-6]
MAKKTIAALKEYFKVGKRPTESQFGDLIDSYVHLDDESIRNLKISEYNVKLEFPENYQIGDYIEFVGFESVAANASGFYEISIAYTRGNIASAATHIAATSHYNQNIWRECGAVNKNNYVDRSTNVCFTVDVNGGLSKFRIRALKTLGVSEQKMQLVVKVRSINKNQAWNVLDNRGNTTENVDRQPMTNEWDLWVGNLFSSESAKIGLKVNTDGNVGIGTGNPRSKLDVWGNILVGNTDGTTGVNAFSIRYEDGSVNNWGSLRSNAETYMSYGAKADNTTAFGWLSSSGSYPSYKTAVTAGNDGIRFLSSSYQKVAQDSPVAMSELMRIIPNGNVGIGTDNPQQKLDVQGVIASQVSSNEGGALLLQNPTKTAFGTANKWAIYNMTGGYGNGLQFWNYSTDGSSGPRLFLSDAGNMALYGKIEAKDVVITATPTADHVFASDYNLREIGDLEKFISEKSHLPEIPSAKEMMDNGLSVGDFQIKLLQKIEELTLYMISIKKEIDVLKTD